MDCTAHTDGQRANKATGSSLATSCGHQPWPPLAPEVEAFLGQRGVTLFSLAVTSTSDSAWSALLYRDATRPSRIDQLLIDFGQSLAAPEERLSPSLLGRLKQRFSDQELALLTNFAGHLIGTSLVKSILR